MRNALLLLLFTLTPAAFAEELPHPLSSAEACQRVPLVKGLDPVFVLDDFFRRRATEEVYYRGEPQDLCGNLVREACREDEVPGAPGSTLPVADKDFLRRAYESDRTLLRSFTSEWESLPEVEQTESMERYVAGRYFEHYKFGKKLDEADANLALTKKYLRRFVERRFPNGEDIQETLADLDKVSLDRDHARHPDFLFRPGANIGYGHRRFAYGGATVRFVRNRATQIFFNSHELGHELERKSYGQVKEVLKCLRTHAPPGRRFDVSEIFGDWVAVQTIAEFLKDSPQLSPIEKQKYIKSTARYFCGYAGTDIGHPHGSYRIRFIESHPVIREALCGEKPLPDPIGQCE